MVLFKKLMTDMNGNFFNINLLHLISNQVLEMQGMPPSDLTKNYFHLVRVKPRPIRMYLQSYSNATY